MAVTRGFDPPCLPLRHSVCRLRKSEAVRPATRFRNNRRAALLQSALPRTITDSTPSPHRWASAYGLFSVPPALFKRGCPPRSTRRAVFPPGSSYFAAARIGCSETVFHPSAFGLRASFRHSPPSGEAEPLHPPLSRMWRATDSCPPHCCEAVFPGYSCPSPGCHRCHC